MFGILFRCCWKLVNRFKWKTPNFNFQEFWICFCSGRLASSSQLGHLFRLRHGRFCILESWEKCPGEVSGNKLRINLKSPFIRKTTRICIITILVTVFRFKNRYNCAVMFYCNWNVRTSNIVTKYKYLRSHRSYLTHVFSF